VYHAFTLLWYIITIMERWLIQTRNSTKAARCLVIRESVFNNSSAGNVLAVVQLGIKTHIRVSDNCVNLINSSSPSICPRRPLCQSSQSFSFFFDPLCLFLSFSVREESADRSIATSWTGTSQEKRARAKRGKKEKVKMRTREEHCHWPMRVSPLYTQWRRLFISRSPHSWKLHRRASTTTCAYKRHQLPSLSHPSSSSREIEEDSRKRRGRRSSTVWHSAQIQ